MKWEYMTLMVPASGLVLGGKIDAQGLTDRLNQLGSEGWELVSVFDTNMTEGKTRDVFAILKREDLSKSARRSSSAEPPPVPS